MRVSSLKYMKRGGFFIPFLIRSKAKIFVSGSASVRLDSRLVIGADPILPLLSAAPSNLYLAPLSEVSIGKSVVIGPGVSLVVKEKGKLEIGSNTFFTSDSHIEVVNSVSIGDNCAISWGVTIIDSNHHKIVIDDVDSSVDGKVVIGNNVWVGCNSTILKDTEIGSNSVVAAGSVVKGKFPENVLIGGNPAKIIKNNVKWEK